MSTQPMPKSWADSVFFHVSVVLGCFSVECRIMKHPVTLCQNNEMLLMPVLDSLKSLVFLNLEHGKYFTF